MVISHGDVVWVDLGVPRGSEPARIRPAVVMQEDWLLASASPRQLTQPGQGMARTIATVRR